MDLITGKTLEQVIADTVVDESKRHSMLPTFLQICQAMVFAHANGVVHRDLKPANIMVGDYGVATVLDWGLAKILANNGLRSDNLDEEVVVPLTQTSIEESLEHPKPNFDTVSGTVMGTPYYLAPEQARGEVVDYRADVFSLGGILCHLLTGSPPFMGDKLSKVYKKSVSGNLSYAFDQLDRCGAPIPIVQLAKRCLDPSVESRPKDASFLVQRLQEYFDSGQRRAEEELVRFFDLSLDLFCIANTQGYFWRLNDNFSRALGYTAKELTSKPFIDFDAAIAALKQRRAAAAAAGDNHDDDLAEMDMAMRYLSILRHLYLDENTTIFWAPVDQTLFTDYKYGVTAFVVCC
jgi:serine/threonine-protein kinase